MCLCDAPGRCCRESEKQELVMQARGRLVQARQQHDDRFFPQSDSFIPESELDSLTPELDSFSFPIVLNADIVTDKQRPFSIFI
eukprot:COSAG06_NODE_3062_length_5904_cov_62.822911_3_plen_84_part_00